MGDEFRLDDRPFRILSGSFHYFRTHPEQWADRLWKMKAAGLNVVDTYIPWNLHEQVRGAYEFDGLWNIGKFIREVDRVGLKLIIRPGPYICTEWELGGFPSWLLHDRTMSLRTSKSKSYLAAVEAYFSELLPVLAAYQYRKGNGPIIAFQVENEFGSFSSDNTYMTFLRRQFQAHGIEEILLTSDGSLGLRNGSVSGALMTVNFMGNAKRNLNALSKIQPNRPLMVMEFWAGWFDHWGEVHHVVDTKPIINTTRQILGDFNASMNFYMFVGGTNFAFWNGANSMKEGYGATVTSYDYDSPISECGDITPKFLAIRNVIQELGLAPRPLPAIPANSDKAAYGNVTMQEYINYHDLIDIISHEKQKVLGQPVAMEYLDINNEGGQGYGFLLYRTFITRVSHLEFRGAVKDRAQIFLNLKHVITLGENDHPESMGPIRISPEKVDNVLDILVENMGRVNFYWARGNQKDILDVQQKGILGPVHTDIGRVDGSWLHVPFEFDEMMITGLRRTQLWTKVKPQNLPAVYRAKLEISGHPKDTFLFLERFSKGIVLINGFNIGRYWKIGPQRTLYVPYPLLNRGINEIIIFETDGMPGTEAPIVTFLDRPILGE